MKGNLQSTRNYDLFELHDLNRDVERTEKLKESMKKHGFIKAYPLHVVKNGSGKLKVKAGHHRLTVAKTLGEPVYYIVTDDSATIQELENATNPWSMKDYLTSYVRQGRPEYIAIQRYVDETGITLGNAISLLAGESAASMNKTKQFKNGNFRLGDQSHANRVKDIVLFLKSKGIDFASSAMFVAGMSKIMWVRGFSISRFKQKVVSHKSFFEKQPNTECYMDMIETIYNRQAKDKLPICFLAKQQANIRKETFGRSGK